jgi:rhamnosyltransferase
VKEALFLITSGTLLDLQRIPPTLRYREEFLVDCVDIDFCLRARALGASVLVDTDLTMVHMLGNRRQGSWRFSPSMYSADRRYLSTRNKTVLWREHWKRYPYFVATDLLVTCLDFVRTLLLEKDRLKTASAFLGGFRSGLRAPAHGEPK